MAIANLSALVKQRTKTSTTKQSSTDAVAQLGKIEQFIRDLQEMAAEFED
eukprot:m.92287 g.92287  ORF g.92287 m.92287 type:complete len:50 (-) comp15064_c0_seq4:285-434(-)